MIFKQMIEILEETKTMTCRINEPKLQVGKSYAIVPGRGKPAWWFLPIFDKVVRIQNAREYTFEHLGVGDLSSISSYEANRYMAGKGAIRCEIIIDRIWQRPLGTMTLQEAQYEGVGSVSEYIALWNKINPRTPYDPELKVWSVEFHISEALATIYRQWKEQS